MFSIQKYGLNGICSGNECMRCWRNKLKHQSPETKKWLKKHPQEEGDFLIDYPEDKKVQPVYKIHQPRPSLKLKEISLEIPKTAIKSKNNSLVLDVIDHEPLPNVLVVMNEWRTDCNKLFYNLKKIQRHSTLTVAHLITTEEDGLFEFDIWDRIQIYMVGNTGTLKRYKGPLTLSGLRRIERK